MEEIKSDVFISFKNHDFEGRVTIDTKIGEEIYNELTSRNIATFYSNSSLLSLGQAVYKRAIDEALENTKVLVVVSSKKEFLESEWVKYEWESFHQDMLSGLKKHCQIVTVFSDMGRENIPRSLRDFQKFPLEARDYKAIADFVENALAAYNKKMQAAKAPTDDLTMLQAVNIVAKPTKKIRWSLYQSDSDKEYERLNIQAKNTHECDMSVLNKLISGMDKKPIWILDLGCAYNFVGNMRFGKMDNVKVLGIDFSEKCIDYAKSHSDSNKFIFRIMDMESEDFEYVLKETMNELGIEKFDIMFGALLLLHLKKPVAVLKKLRKFLSPDGYIVMRGSDDGSVLALNDDGVIQQIVDKCNTTVGFSDRQNGRKLYHQLVSAGYVDVKVETFLKDLSGKSIDERDEIFFERFSYRVNNFEKISNADPTNKQKKDDYMFMKYALQELETIFSNQDFWYCEHDFIAIAKVRKPKTFDY